MMASKVSFIALLQFVAFVPIQCFQQSLYRRQEKILQLSNSAISKPFSVVSALHAESPDADIGGSEEPTSNGAMGGLMSMGDSLKSQLASAFSALDESDQYDAVLTGLCAKILDQPTAESGEVIEALQDPLQLLEEMNSRRIQAGSRSLMALIDAAVTAQDAKIVAQVLSLGARNGGISRFGNLQTDVIPMPTMRSSKVRCPDGVTRTRGERLDSLVEVPYDDRGTEVASALAIAAIVGFCGTVNVLGLDQISIFTNIVSLRLSVAALLRKLSCGRKLMLSFHSVGLDIHCDCWCA